MADDKEVMDVGDHEEMEEEDEVDDEVDTDDDDDTEMNEGVQEEENGDDPQVFIPGVSETNVEPQDLEFDESTYVLYHEAQSGYPCLSFDIIPEPDTVDTQNYPMSVSFVAGTQASKQDGNHIMVIRMTNLHKMKQKEDEDDDSEIDDDSDEDEDEDRRPLMKTVSIKVDAGVNRVRQCRLNDKTLAACWIESGSVQIYDITDHVKNLSLGLATPMVDQKPVKQFRGHRSEGFAMDWSPTVPGRFLSGDCNKDIHLWEPASHSGGWNVDQRPLKGHLSSVEDIQWSPSEKNVFASCSSDKSIRIWDVRAQPHKANMLSVKDAHDADVNVIHWNRNDPFLVSGGDDGMLKVWDLRLLRDKKTVATFKQHTGPITSVEWHPTDSSVFAASGEDHQVTLWDLAVEKDGAVDTSDSSVPPQLLFIHMGQKNLKEVHWHPQYSGMVLSTAESGFNVFKTISV